MATPDWFQQGACRSLAPGELFLKGLKVDYTQSARGMCAMCPVRVECLEHAVANPSLCGLWGGTDERERQAIRNLRAKHKKAS